ncbi:MAG: type II secretion system F family protein [Actinomycetes bacterium]
MIVLALVAALGLTAFTLLQRGGSDERAAELDDRFATATQRETSTVVRSLLRLARPLANSAAANPPEESPSYKAIRLKLAAAGGAYGGFVEVFLATQIAATIVGATALAAVALARPADHMLALAGIVGGLGVIAWPYSTVWEAAKKRTAAVDNSLPEFVELLLMPLTSGMSIVQSLSFTADRIDSPVAIEVRHLVDMIRTRAIPEEQAFTEAGENLGTPAARSFFGVLTQAHLEGTRAASTLAGQAVQLRKVTHERLREKVAKMENTIAIMTGIHLLPSLMVLVLFPAAGSLSGM